LPLSLDAHGAILVLRPERSEGTDDKTADPHARFEEGTDDKPGTSVSDACALRPRLRNVATVVSDGETLESAGSWSLQLPHFEGPLDLLLHLCQKHELNILDIPIAFVTEKYLEYLAVMELMQLDLAAEYLLMAATLAHIKSKMLLPATPADQEDDADAADEVDPREALIKRLLEYQKYKHAGEELAARGVAGRDVFGRGIISQALADDGESPGRRETRLAEIPLFALVDAFQRVLDRSKIKLSHDVVADRISLSDRMGELSDLLASRKRVTFDETFAGLATKFDLIITFLALLELTRLKMTRLFQSEPLGPLYIELAASEEVTAAAASQEERSP
jgi:segregation and condensation protein A